MALPITIKAAAGQFGTDLASQGLAKGTIRLDLGYITGRAGFMAACHEVKGENATMGQIDHYCVSAYFAAHVGANGAWNNKLTSVRKFLKWAEKRKLLRPGFTAEDLLDGKKNKKTVRKPKLYVPPERFGEMLDRAGEIHPRDRAFVALTLYTLERQSETKVKRLRDLDLAERSITAWRQKTSEWTLTGMTPELHAEMIDWLGWYAAHTLHASIGQMAARHPDWLLAPAGRRGSYWEYMLPEKQYGVPEHIMHRTLLKMGYTPVPGEGCHTIRRSGARALFTNLRDNIGFDGALVKVQTMLNHKNPQQTLTYIGMDQERDELNTWLRANSMYGTGSLPPEPAGLAGSNVVPLKRRSA
jgi:integrase